MLKSQTLALELSEKREALNKLNLLDDLSAEQKTERGNLTTRLVEIEPEIRAAMVAENVTETNTLDDAENRELRALADAASIGRIMQAAVEHRAVDGAEAEIQEHYKLDGNQIPLIMLRGERETRAVTPAPGDVGQTQSPIIPGVFPMACAAFLGVDMPTAGVGDSRFSCFDKQCGSGCTRRGRYTVRDRH